MRFAPLPQRRRSHLAVAASGSGGAAASNRLLRRFPIASRSFGRGLGSDCGDFPVAAPPRLNGPDPATPVGRVEFVADAKDLESDEALWALYERWCKAFGQERDQDEMRRRFNKFKRTVFHVDRINKEAIRDCQSLRLEINKLADGKLREAMACEISMAKYLERLPYAPNTQIFGSGGNILVEEEDPNPWA